jgi:hypothetical protein
MSGCHWWYLLFIKKKKIMRWDLINWFRIWQFQTLAYKRCLLHDSHASPRWTVRFFFGSDDWGFLKRKWRSIFNMAMASMSSFSSLFFSLSSKPYSPCSKYGLCLAIVIEHVPPSRPQSPSHPMYSIYIPEHRRNLKREYSLVKILLPNSMGGTYYCKPHYHVRSLNIYLCVVHASESDHSDA